jgi:hypothetical protein
MANRVPRSRWSQFGAVRPVVVLMVGMFLPGVGVAALPVPTDCTVDAQGANDEPGQKDLTEFCGEAGVPPYELYVKFNFDTATIAGGSTNDACILFDSDSDGLANFAVCATARDHGGPANLGAVRLFTCNNSRPDRCAGAVQLAGNECVGGADDGAACADEADCDNPSPGVGICVPVAPLNTACEMYQNSDDPFPAGADYPTDTDVVCAIDVNDFGAGGAVLLDACSFPSEQPGSDPSDCIAFATCTADTDCDDGNDCTIDTCDTMNGFCLHMPDTGASCETGDLCTVDTCNDLGFCEAGGPENCNDNNACTDDSCDPNTGCVNTNNTDPCDDGNACTTNDACAGGACVGGAPPNCNDNNACTDDSCDPNTGCVNTNNTDPCDDGNACTTNDACASGACVGGAPPNCNDNNACTDDSCDPNTGCVNSNNTDSCDDGNACTTNDACAGGACVGGSPPNCDDQDVCTADSCDPISGCMSVFDPPNPLPPSETNCADMEDNDCDMLVDCADPDCGDASDPNALPTCQDGTLEGTVCDTPEVVAECEAGGGACRCGQIKKDPATIVFRDGLDMFKAHGRVEPQGSIDLQNSTVGWIVSNQQGIVYRGRLHPQDFVASPSGTSLRFKDKDAKKGLGTHDGIYKAVVRVTRGGTSYGFKVVAFSDLSAAVDANMAVQFYFTAPTMRSWIHDKPWTQQPWGWKATAFR